MSTSKPVTMTTSHQLFAALLVQAIEVEMGARAQLNHFTIKTRKENRVKKFLILEGVVVLEGRKSRGSCYLDVEAQLQLEKDFAWAPATPLTFTLGSSLGNGLRLPYVATWVNYDPDAFSSEVRVTCLPLGAGAQVAIGHDHREQRTEELQFIKAI